MRVLGNLNFQQILEDDRVLGAMIPFTRVCVCFHELVETTTLAQSKKFSVFQPACPFNTAEKIQTTLQDLRSKYLLDGTGISPRLADIM